MVFLFRTRHVRSMDFGVNSVAEKIVKLPSSAPLSLSRFLEPIAHKFVFGDDNTNLITIAKKRHNQKRPIKVYMVAPNSAIQQIELVKKLWNNVSSKVQVLEINHYFPQKSIREGIRLRRDIAAVLSGASKLYGYPTLVIDMGRHMMTYAASNSKGVIYGQGSGLGVEAKLRAWKSYSCHPLDTSTLPNTNEFFEKASKLICSKNICKSQYLDDPIESVICDIVNEIKAKALHVIHEWLEWMDNQIEEISDLSLNSSRSVVLTGEDAKFLMSLIQSESQSNFDLKCQEYIFTNGVTSALLNSKSGEIDKINTPTINPNPIVEDVNEVIEHPRHIEETLEHKSVKGIKKQKTKPTLKKRSKGFKSFFEYRTKSKTKNIAQPRIVEVEDNMESIEREVNKSDKVDLHEDNVVSREFEVSSDWISSWMQTKLSKDQSLQNLLGTRVAKSFYSGKGYKSKIYYGTVSGFQPSFVGIDGHVSDKTPPLHFLIQYDDGDSEHVTRNELHGTNYFLF